jgi:hypothetical protein
MRFTQAERERVANCSICKHLADLESVDHIREIGSLPEQVEQLEIAAPLMRCPECGTYYKYEHDCGYMENDESYTRLSDREARILLGQEIGDRALSNEIKDSLTPVLKERGFKPVNRTNPWSWYAWRDECVWLVEVRTVDKHWFYGDYCQQRGFPRQSLVVRCGAFYEFMPTRRAIELYSWPDLDREPVKRLKGGQPRPVLRDFQASVDLDCPSAPSQSSAIWRVEQNGSNLGSVLAEIKGTILAEGLAWLEKMRDLKSALQELDAQLERLRKIDAGGRHEIFVAYCMADKVGDEDMKEKYSALLDQEWDQEQSSLSGFFD